MSKSNPSITQKINSSSYTNSNESSKSKGLVRVPSDPSNVVSATSIQETVSEKKDIGPPPPTYLPPPAYIPPPPFILEPANENTKESFKGKEIKINFLFYLDQVIDWTNRLDKRSLFLEWKRKGSKREKYGSTKSVQINATVGKWDQSQFSFTCKFGIEKGALKSKLLHLKLKEGDRRVIGKSELELSLFALEDGSSTRREEFKKGKIQIEFRVKSTLLWIDDQLVLGQVDPQRIKSNNNTYLYIFGQKAYRSLPVSFTEDTTETNDYETNTDSTNYGDLNYHFYYDNFRKLIAEKEDQILDSKAEIAELIAENRYLKVRNRFYENTQKQLFKVMSPKLKEISSHSNTGNSQHVEKTNKNNSELQDLISKIGEIESKIRKTQETFEAYQKNSKVRLKQRRRAASDGELSTSSTSEVKRCEYCGSNFAYM